MSRGAALALALTGLAAIAAPGCAGDPGVGDGGLPLGRPPRRSCQTLLRVVPPHPVARMRAAGEWNKFNPDETLLEGPDSSGAWETRLDLAPGSYAYKLILDDSEWILDPANPYSKYVEGLENSVLEVDDCRNPRVDFLALDKSSAGDLHAEAQFLDGGDAESSRLDSTLVEVWLDGAVHAGFSVSTEGRIVVNGSGLSRGKHRLLVRATDRDGRSSNELVVPFWIEDLAFDFRDGLMYFVFTDRFRNGTAANDAPAAGVDPIANYAGGDFQGVLDALNEGYFDQLGVRSLWLSPPNANPAGAFPGSDGHPYSGYHGYWPSAGRAVQSRFGTLDTLKALVSAAHARGIRVLVDSVLNHVHTEHPLYQQHGSSGWFNGDGSCVCGGPGCDWEQRKIDCWFTSYLPDVNYENFDAMRAMIEDSLFWVREVDVDGFRVDAVKHFHHAATRRLRARLHDEFEHAGTLFYLVGETFTGGDDAGRGLIASFLGPTELHGQFDFPLFWSIRAALGTNSAALRDLERAAAASDGAYGGAPMSPFFGNHDVPRFISEAAGHLWSDSKAQAWVQPPAEPLGSLPYERLRLAITFLGTQPGVPLLYYGDELGLAGTQDPDNRRMMKWSGLGPEQLETLEWSRRVGVTRTRSLALGRGSRTTLWVDDDLYVYARIHGQRVAVVGLNRAGLPRTETIPIPSSVPLPEGTILVDRLGGLPTQARSETMVLTLGPRESAIWEPY